MKLNSLLGKREKANKKYLFLKYLSVQKGPQGSIGKREMRVLSENVSQSVSLCFWASPKKLKDFFTLKQTTKRKQLTGRNIYNKLKVIRKRYANQTKSKNVSVCVCVVISKVVAKQNVKISKEKRSFLEFV